MTPTSIGQPRRILVLSDEPLKAALLALLLELESYSPVFAAPGEHADAAVARLRPLLVVLADFDLEESRSDIFVAKVARYRIGIAYFGSAARGGQLGEWASARGLPWLVLPADASDIGNRLKQAAASAGERRLGGEPRKPRIEVGADGFLHLLDSSGRRWAVYDRRGADRRGSHLQVESNFELRGGDAGSYRAFIAESGEERRCPLSAAEFDADSPVDLERQLDRAISV
jgi:CheY-like chemotaxis protein